MFEAAELGQKISKEEYDKQEPALREALLKAQYALLKKPDFPVIVLVSGVDGAGKTETANLFHEWMDPRHLKAAAFGPPSDEELERPPMWRYWRALPPKGRIGIMFGSWYSEALAERVKGGARNDTFLYRMEEIRHFERMLVAEGALLIKLWFHLSKKAQKKRIADLQDDERTRWQVTKVDIDHLKTYDRFRKVAEVALRESGTAEAPWTLIEGADERYRSITAATVLLDALQARLAAPVPAPMPAAKPVRAGSKKAVKSTAAAGRNVINTLDYSAKLEDKEYKERLAELQGRLAKATRRKKFNHRSLILVFEGQDAAGKGSTVRRITQALDARRYSIIPIAAPTEEERAQPYLWRFWRQLPRQGRVTIFDRSWYGRVLVERVEGFAQPADWLRAYPEINQFESQLVDSGAIVLKFWLAITKEEQLARFRAREKTPFKSFKITAEDWRNRKKWDAYEAATCDMIERTSTATAPWHLIAGNDKQYARIAVLEAICDALDKKL